MCAAVVNVCGGGRSVRRRRRRSATPSRHATTWAAGYAVDSTAVVSGSAAAEVSEEAAAAAEVSEEAAAGEVCSGQHAAPIWTRVKLPRR